MTGFFWSAGHIGWGFFVVLVFTGVWFLSMDLVWRLRTLRILRFGWIVLVGWLAGAGLIVAASILVAS